MEHYNLRRAIPYLTAQHAQNLFKFRNFYNQMDFRDDMLLVVAKAIIELIDTSGAA